MSQETKDRLLDAAETLFVRHGIQATSLRSITGEAGANLAAVNYHFGSKEGLIRAVLERRLQPLNAYRLELLDALERRAAQGGPEPTVEEILDALVRPAFQLSSDSGQRHLADWTNLLARLHFELDESLIDLLVDSFGEAHERFFGAMLRALPELTEKQLLYRMHFTIGAMAMTLVNQRLIARISKGLISATDAENAAQRLINFLAHGFRAPRSQAEQETSTRVFSQEHS
ncbi:MAG: TetR/AcrR family transcriptional regulator [Acidobacteriota bacterium]